MGQGWLVVDLDGRTTVELGKLGESLTHEYTTIEFPHYLWRVQVPASISPSKKQVMQWVQSTRKSAHQLQTTGISIQMLPVELLQLIFGMIEEFSDVICLALASEHIFRAGEFRIRAETQQSWAGHRLICVGNYLDNEDIPQGLLTSDEQEELNCGVLEDDGEPHTLHSLALERFSSVSSCMRHNRSNYFFQHFVSLSAPGEIQMLIGRMVFKEIVDQFNPRVQDNDKLILRNLTKKQYVREGATSTSLGTIVLARICWSSDSSCNMAYKGHALTRGVWAGDRFDITTLDQLEEGTGWTDVSKEVDDEMGRIWENEYGPEWKRIRPRYGR